MRSRRMQQTIQSSTEFELRRGGVIAFLCVAVGSEFNLEPGGGQVRSKILSMNLDGSDLQVHAHGIRALVHGSEL